MIIKLSNLFDDNFVKALQDNTINYHTPNIYDSNNTHIFEHLISTYKKHKDFLTKKDLIQKILNHPELDISSLKIQHNLMKYWMDNYSNFNLKSFYSNNETTLFNQNLYSHINWTSVIPNFEDLKLKNNHNNVSTQKNQTISWLQFAILENWGLARNGLKYSKDIECSINLKNSLNDNIWHTIAKSFTKTPRDIESINEMFTLLIPHYQELINQKNNDSFTPIDILNDNIHIYENKNEDEVISILKHSISLIEKYDLKKTLTNKLPLKSTTKSLKL